METHSTCVTGVFDNEMRYPELHKKHINKNEQTSNPLTVTDNEESLHAFVTSSLLG